MLKVNCDESGLKIASKEIQEGKVIVYPTDTVYGLGCDPRQRDAINRIFTLKGRAAKPMPVLCSHIKDVRKCVYLGQTGLILASKFWPGALTIVSKLVDTEIPKELTGVSRKLGVRIPNHTCARRLISLSGGALVGTSANRSGLRSPTTSQEAINLIGKGIDVLVEGGPTLLAMESTVIDLSDGEVSVLREGAIRKSQIYAALK